jgi:hypothetical protein
LTRNRDKKRLNLVCKEFAFVCTPLLYRHMAISIKTLNDDLAPMLSRPETHSGLMHVRILSIGGGVNRTGNYEIPPHDRSALRHLLSAIPEKVLTKFRYVHIVTLAGLQSVRLSLIFFTAFGLVKMILAVIRSTAYCFEHNDA